MGQEGHQRLPVAIDADQKNRFLVEPDLRPGQHFEKLVEGTCAAG
jgi:hypothetical protein